MKRLLAATLITLGLAACGSAQASENANDNSAVEQTDPPVAQTDPPAADASDFVTAFVAAHGDDMDAVIDETEAASVSASEYDLSGMQRHSTTAAYLYSEMYDTAISLPGVDTEVGRLTVQAYASCRDAYGTTSELFKGAYSLDDVDVRDIEISVEMITDCNDDLYVATAAITAFNES